MLMLLQAVAVVAATGVDGGAVRRRMQASSNNSNNNNSNPENNSTEPSASEKTRNVLIIFLIGVASTLCMVLLAYITATVMDLLLRDGYSNNHGNSETSERPRMGLAFVDHGPISRKANLWGITYTERARILPHLFQATTFQWKLDVSDGTTTYNTTRTTTTASTTAATKLDDDQEDSQWDHKPADEVHETETDGEADVAAHHDEACCSICLNPFTTECSVMTGTKCPHVFHASCCMSWLQRQDHCPYCRQEMMTPEEFRQAAIEVLGLRRVQALALPGVQGTLEHARRSPSQQQLQWQQTPPSPSSPSQQQSSTTQVIVAEQEAAPVILVPEEQQSMDVIPIPSPVASQGTLDLEAGTDEASQVTPDEPQQTDQPNHRQGDCR